MLTRRHSLALLAAGCAAPLWSSAARAQGSFPDQPVKMIVPFAPGGPADIIARIIGQVMGTKLGQPVVVDSRSGAGGAVGVEAAARSRPDGLTTVLASTGALVVLPHLMPRMAYDAQKDLAPITHVLSVPQILVVKKGRGMASVADVVAQARQQPGKLTFGSAGNGSSLHLAGELFKLKAGIDITHVPYRGAAPAVTDLLAGTIDMILADVPVVLPHIRSGEVLALGVTAEQRAPILPEVPTMAEAGAPGVVSQTWYALFAPAGTPADRIAKLHDAAAAALQDNDVRRSLADQGGQVVGSAPEQLAAFMVSENKKWGELVKLANVTLN
ncbi:Bug family tripartite tricarboxylate transporter substrate binding protein [Roseomonas marmotae]|uniref:Tripartite tricarboxylate transporter substrate binding protein n=1 Tax=Roseomonas marmotae TaxID=2768161 RepID=A0ABS3KH96_9PROT|nr:tripartite tricarboxylate transporter substrate binding protein [Roseomonas marmotae]MBO1076856.1 tripartite tricarboxylate transporter substrate binding protein [Roseomonas marmotae]QTI81192.1 tripartite tricarboxylate transporter substrate binding protein [Roseomonas marmotae]